MSGLIHAGANDGREYVGRSRRMVLIEPQAAPFQRLAETFRGQRTKLLVNAALGARAGEAVMRVASNDESSSLLDPLIHLEMYGDTPFDRWETVRVERLDDVMARIPGEFDELVIDVQGYELEVLKGAERTLEGIRWIKTEVNAVEMFRGCALIADLDAFLAERGFERVHTDLSPGGGAWGDATYERRS